MEKLLIRESERTKGNIHIIKMFLIFFFFFCSDKQKKTIILIT